MDSGRPPDSPPAGWGFDSLAAHRICRPERCRYRWANYRYFAALAEDLHLRRLADAFEVRAVEISALATWQNGTPISVSPESPPTSASCSLPRPVFDLGYQQYLLTDCTARTVTTTKHKRKKSSTESWIV
ncbi:hypothetical protein ACFQH9_20830 [Pseudonocardia lutea]|uniref:Uncharacterized protein n=1 Tax=Pseudonocardia lutea TaxID=2172015 RepID=A0ABW1ID63_9PSEU